MTQEPAPAPSDRGAVRAAVEGLLRACVDLERNVDGVSTDSGKRVRGLTETLAAVRLPSAVLDVPALAQEIDGAGRLLDADLQGQFAEARQPLITEIHALLGLLAPVHGLAALPPLMPAGPGAALADHFPTGFAHDYVKDLLASVDPSLTLPAREVGAVPVQSEVATDAAKVLVSERLPQAHRDEGLEMLRNALCHAVERHGHHIAAVTQLARLVWLKDPTGHEVWRLLLDGAAESEHWCGPVSGGFTSPDAMAKPLATFLQWAHDHAGGVNDLINKHAPKNAKRFGVHVDAELAGLAAGDAAEYRGTATTNKGRTTDWVAARRWTMANGGPPMYGVPHDPIAEGKDPGVTLAFKRVGKETWRLVTYFPVDRQNPDNERLEDLT